MSQRNRPGSAQALAEQQRMPLAAAEALLWGKRTHGEHVVLNARMQELEEQHRAYNSRIQATETISEAAEAATARIRRIEHQVAAIESDEQDRPFDKWVEGEVADFKVFVERNKTVRQKQVELETKISGIEDSIDKVIDTFPDIEILLERIGRLESERLKDANQIKKLEADVAKLKIRRQTQVIEVARARPEVTPRPTVKHMLPPPSAQLFAEPEDAAEETEDEEILPVFPTVPIEQERFPHPSSLKTISKGTSTIRLLSPQKSRDDMSARLRMMQRKSIHDPKHSRDNGPRPIEALMPHAKPLPRSLPVPLPATQIVKRPDAEKSPRRQNDFSRTAKQSPTKQLVVKLPMGPLKRKAEEIVEVPRLTRSQARKNNELLKHKETQPEHNTTRSKSQEIISNMETQIGNEPAAKRRKPNTAQPPPQPRTNANITVKSPTKTPAGATNLVKTSPHKTAATASPRKTAVTMKQSEPTKELDQPQTQVLSSPRKKPAAKSNVPARSMKQDSRSTAVPKATLSSWSSFSPAKTAKLLESFVSSKKSATTPAREEAAPSTSVEPLSSRSGPARSSRGSRRPPLVSPVTLDPATYEQMKKKSNMII